jgi:hypothetical protein
VDYFGLRKLEEQVTKRSSVEDVSRPRGYPVAVVPMPVDAPDDATKQMIRQAVQSYGPLLVLTLLDDSQAWARWLGAALAIGYGLPALLALIVTAVSIPFSVIFSLGLLPCGWTLPFAGPYLDLTAEPAPPGTWSVTQLRASGESSLSHGRSHDDWLAIDFVCDWLKDRLAAAEGSRPASV